LRDRPCFCVILAVLFISLAKSRTGLFPNVERPIDESEFNQPPQVEPSTNATGARVSTKYRAEGLVLDSALLRGTLP
jgi:hypothetical protein